MPDLYTATKKTLGHVLSQVPPVSVPEYQRRYSWTLTEVTTFWDDLRRFESRYPGPLIEHQEYFLGSIVVVDDGVNLILLDGQQRLATSAILLSSIRDALSPHNTMAADRLAQQFLKWTDPFDPRAFRYQLNLNSFDNPFFQREVLDSRDGGWSAPIPSGSSHRMLRGAREYFDLRFAELFASLPTDEACRYASRLGNVVTNHFSVVQVASKDEDNAAEVFETLNDRGLSLSTADLLQNFLLRRTSPSTRQETKRLWHSMLNVLNATKTEEYLRHFWISREGDVKSKSLYRAIKDEVEVRGIEGITLARELAESASVYSAILRAQHPNPQLQKLYRDLGLLGAKALLPLALSANTRDIPEVVAILRAAIALFVRHTLIGKRDGSLLENTVFRAARLARSSAPLASILAELRVLMPADDEFRRDFSSAALTRNKHQKYVLSELELHRRGTGELQVAPTITVEHIYPRAPAFQRWADHDDAISLIGNLTILSQRLNSQARNAEFARKVASYRGSSIEITRELATMSDWNLASIRARQQRLAEAAVAVWTVQ